MTARSRLRTAWQRTRSEPGLGRNLTAIAGLVLIGSIVATYFLSNQRFNPPWEDKQSIYATFAEAPAVSPGNGQEVRIAGVSVGDIRSAKVSEDGRAVLKLRIDSHHEVYDNAKVTLRPKSPLNDMYVELNPGSPSGQKLDDGDTLPVANSVSPVQVDEVLGHLDDNAQAAVTTLLSEADVALTNAPDKLPDGLTMSTEVMADLEPVVKQLDARREKLSRLATALADISSATGSNDERLTRLASSLQKVLGTVADRGESLDQSLEELPEFADELRRASKSVSHLIGQLDPTLENVLDASEELPDALSRFGDSVDELDSFLDDARPVVKGAEPVVADLRPAASDLKKITGDLRPITQQLEPLTDGLVPYLDDLSAFVYNTNSVASLRDANRGILRGQFAVSPESVPLGLDPEAAENSREGGS
ncbi:MlaD family protein [Aeromicrobium sp. CTD01-1L150]|uniref:MlaD family protein n=1 Tax=Aeromicrobium sp. CTD01-1L150 TaxID=3341830 RepID=UPI0035BF02E0